MTLDGSALKRLAAIQQTQGHVTLAEIGSVLPVSSMSPEEIGETMAQLEAAGIDIEVDQEFLRHRLDSGLADARPASHSRFGAPDAGGPMIGHTDQGSLLPRATAPAPPKLSVGELRVLQQRRDVFAGPGGDRHAQRQEHRPRGGGESEGL